MSPPTQKEAATPGDGGLDCHRVQAGNFVHVESGTHHACRNDTGEPVVDLLITGNRLGKFFQEVGRPTVGAPQLPSPDDLARFAAVAAK